MFRLGDSIDEADDHDHEEAAEILEETAAPPPVFGDFDPDDPDFLPLQPARPRSRMSGSRNSSSSSLRRNASQNSIGRLLSTGQLVTSLRLTSSTREFAFEVSPPDKVHLNCEQKRFDGKNYENIEFQAT